jgi:hypothetical protein
VLPVLCGLRAAASLQRNERDAKANHRSQICESDRRGSRREKWNVAVSTVMRPEMKQP